MAKRIFFVEDLRSTVSMVTSLKTLKNKRLDTWANKIFQMVDFGLLTSGYVSFMCKNFLAYDEVHYFNVYLL